VEPVSGERPVSVDRALASALRSAYPRALARVLAFTRNLVEAEDALHDAIEAAVASWRTDGMPDSPEAWLVAVARNRHRDRLRHARHVADHAADALARLSEASPWSADRAAGWDDELLGLVFTACDPLLEEGEAAALTLATVIGLSVGEIAAAFLVAPRSMEQRLTRARLRLRERRGELHLAPPGPTPERLDAALRVIHLIYTEGHWASGGEPAIRGELCQLALGLAGSLARLHPDEGEATGLLALLSLHEARRAARLDAEGRPVKLPDQDRSRWDAEAIRGACALLGRTLARGRPGPFQLEAAIAAVHCEAASAEATDWRQIAELYRLLEVARPSPVVRVNRAFAVARAEGPAAGLALLPDGDALPAGLRYPYAELVRGVFLSELGRVPEAIAALEAAARKTDNPHERQEIARRLATLTRR
jgi:RNA polymerase sigma-70 factor (ECF subfamily)